MKLTDEQLDALRKSFRLSPRELQIVSLIFEGTTHNRLLASRLGVAEGTVKGQLVRLFLKIRCLDKGQLILRCLETLASEGLAEFE